MKIRKKTKDGKIVSKRSSKSESVVKLFVVNEHPGWIVYGGTIVISILTIAGTEMFWSFGDKGASHTMLPLATVLLCAVVGGLGPGLVATLVIMAAMLLLLSPSNTFAVEDVADRLWLGLFIVIAIGITILGAALKNALQAGFQASRTLEETVSQRTSELVKANEDLRRLLSEIQQSQHFLDSLINNIPSTIFVLNAKDHRIMRINKAGERLLGPLDRWIGKTIFELLDQAVAENYAAIDREVIRSGKPSEREETFPSPIYGNRILFTRRVPLFDTDGKVTYILGISDDISEKKRLETQTLDLVYEQAARIESDRKKAELEEALRARDTFLSISSHELKNPLTSLKLQTGIVRMLIEKHDDTFLFSERMQKLMQETDNEIDRILRMIDDMLDVSRIRSGKLSLRPENVDLSKIVTKVVDRFQREPTYKKADIRVCVPESAEGYWDPHRIEQVVVNLVSNALKYGEGKPITISVSRIDDKYTLIVEDQGLGIAPEYQPRIFQRFERADAPESITGLGLGLFIVKEIVNRHGGVIWVESQKGRGSKFIVQIPIAAQILPKAA